MKLFVRPGDATLDLEGSSVPVREVIEAAGLEKKALAVRVAGVNLTLADTIDASLAEGPTMVDGTERQVVGGGAAGDGGDGTVPEGAILVDVLTRDGPEGLDVLRHSTAHVLADAVLRLYPGARLTIGPSIADGFYYDIDFSGAKGSPGIDDLPRIEEEMQKIVKADHEFRRDVTSPEQAKERLRGTDDRFKVEIIDEYAAKGVEQFSFYGHGDFEDLCRGPHLPRTGMIGAFKLTSISGTNWRAIETNPPLTRIYGTAFWTPKLLKVHLKNLEERKKRDHRRLGEDLELFSFQKEAPGAPFWHPKGATIYGALQAYCREKYPLAGYEEVVAPLILSEELWHRSGHWDNFRENMYFTRTGHHHTGHEGGDAEPSAEGETKKGKGGEEQQYAVKPMNCPGHCLIFKDRRRNYHDLPMRLAEYSQLHRFERAGALHGLMRVRSFAQDDAHIYCSRDQLADEIAACIALQREVYRDLGFCDWSVKLATRPAKRVGDDAMWDEAEAALAASLDAAGLAYELLPGEGAFYGPKIEFHIHDCLGRSWQCGTAQVDFSMPARFELKYQTRENTYETPVMIHRAVLGSFERLIGILIEHYAGEFPLWLSPEQVRVLPIRDGAHEETARDVVARLRRERVRVALDAGSDLRKRIKSAGKARVPYLVVIGDEEVETGRLAVRHRKKQDLGTFTLDELVVRLRDEIDSRARLPVGIDVTEEEN